jgi:hypothetical protein
MIRGGTWLWSLALLLVATGCGDDGGETVAGSAETSVGSGGATSSTGVTGGSGASASTGSGGSTGDPAYDDAKAKIEAYKAAHPGNGGKDWDINAKSDEELAADPDAQELLALCGDDQRPVIPLLAWEYGGNDHQWMQAEESALVYCVYIPVDPSTEHWQYDAALDHVAADVYVKFPEQNPCKEKEGADQVMACLGDPSNIEILVDTASLNDGVAAGLNLAEASTVLYLILPDSTKVHMYTGL